MINDKENSSQQQANAENEVEERVEQFNELSELSLEERMAVADRIGIPVRTAGDAAALGTASGPDESEAYPGEPTEEESTDEAPDR